MRRAWYTQGNLIGVSSGLSVSGSLLHQSASVAVLRPLRQKRRRAPGLPDAQPFGRAWTISRVLSSPRLIARKREPQRVATISLAAPLPTRSMRSTRPHSDRTGRLTPENRRQRGLHDLARSGACLAPTVTSRAVRSYRTISPLPVLTPGKAQPKPSAVFFLWRCPSPATDGRVGVVHHCVLPCSDFPLTPTRSPEGELADSSGRLSTHC